MKRFIFAVFVAALMLLIWDFSTNLMLLSKYRTVSFFHRETVADSGNIYTLLRYGFIYVLFVAFGHRFKAWMDWRSGARFGFCIGLCLAVVSGIGAYIAFPIPAWVAMHVFANGLVPNVLIGAVVGNIIRS